MHISLFKICLYIFWRKCQIFHDSHLGTCVNFPSSNMESSLCNIWENFYQLSCKNEWKILSHTWKYVPIWYEILFHPRKFEWMFSNMKYRIKYLSDLRIDFFSMKYKISIFHIWKRVDRFSHMRTFCEAQLVKHLPAVLEIWVTL